MGENLPRFDFSIIDYSVMNKSQLLKFDSVGAWKLNESLIVLSCVTEAASFPCELT